MYGFDMHVQDASPFQFPPLMEDRAIGYVQCSSTFDRQMTLFSLNFLSETHLLLNGFAHSSMHRMIPIANPILKKTHL